MARPANVDPTGSHIFFVEVFLEPFVGVAFARNEVMKGGRSLARAQGAGVIVYL